MTVTKSGPGDERIFDVGFDAVGFIENGGNSTLGVESRAFANRPFAQDGNQWRSARRSASDNPAAPLPIINTSQEKSGVVFIASV